jgi:branched-chain amino acid transport system ATP-binding protein
MSTLLAIQDLRSFYGVSQALHGVSLSISRGEQIALIGRNGMGKTTLLKSIVGLLADRRGEIVFAGVSTAKAQPEEIARRVCAHYRRRRTCWPSSARRRW